MGLHTAATAAAATAATHTAATTHTAHKSPPGQVIYRISLREDKSIVYAPL
jgi:hypothetical protein